MFKNNEDLTICVFPLMNSGQRNKLSIKFYSNLLYLLLKVKAQTKTEWLCSVNPGQYWKYSGFQLASYILISMVDPPFSLKSTDQIH